MKKLALLAAALLFIMAATPDRKPRILIIGDSISMGYTPFVKALFQDVAAVIRPDENCSGTLYGVKKIDEWLALGNGKWDVIHFNFGLHDLKHVDPATGQASKDPAHPNGQTPAQYAANLETMIARMQKTGARLIFATTTPFHGIQPNPYRDSTQVAVYNAAAVEVCKRHGVAVNDRCGDVLAHPDMMRKNNVHFFTAGSRALSDRVCNAVLKELDVRGK